MLKGLPILIVEDEAVIAMCLAEMIADLGGCVVGPVGKVSDALALIEEAPIAAAILDANLLDRDVTPVALALTERALPFIIHSGTGLPDELAQRYPDLPLVLKPAHSMAVLAALLHRVSPDRARFE